MDMRFLMQQAQKIQKDITKAQQLLAQKENEATAGGGAMKIKATGNMRLTEVHIEPELANEVEDLEAMLVMCVNSLMEAIEKYKEAIMKPITGGAKVPGAF